MKIQLHIQQWIKRPIIFIAVILFSFMISSAVYLLDSGRKTRFYYYFPVNNYETVNLEIRSLPKYHNREKNVQNFLKDLFLGPVILDLAKVIPSGTYVNAILLRGSIVYVDFDKDIEVNNEKFPLKLDEIFTIITKNLKYNFMFIEDVRYTIDGQIPGSSYYELKS